MHRDQDWPQHFSDIEEMPQRPQAEILAAIAVTPGFDGPDVINVGVVPQS